MNIKEDKTVSVKPSYKLSNTLAVLPLLAFLGVYLPKALNQPHQLANTVETFLGGDLAFHFLAAFCITLCCGYLLGLRRAPKRQFARTSVILLALLCLDELIQVFLPYRFASWADCLANTSGWAAAILCWMVIRRSSGLPVPD